MPVHPALWTWVVRSQDMAGDHSWTGRDTPAAHHLWSRHFKPDHDHALGHAGQMACTNTEHDTPGHLSGTSDQAPVRTRPNPVRRWAVSSHGVLGCPRQDASNFLLCWFLPICTMSDRLKARPVSQGVHVHVADPV